MEEAKVDIISSLNLDPSNKEALSMFACLFSSQTIDEVMESDFAQLVIEALQSVLTEKAQSFGNFESIQGIYFIKTNIITSFLIFQYFTHSSSNYHSEFQLQENLGPPFSPSYQRIKICCDFHLKALIMFLCVRFASFIIPLESG